MKYKTIRTISGKKFRVAMGTDEIRERRIFRAVMTITTLFCVVAFWWAGGLC